MHDIEVSIPRKAFNSTYLPYLDCKSRYLVLYGGAGSGKSVFAVQRFLVRLLSSDMHNILVARAVGNTHRNSTFALFRQIINKWGLCSYFRVNMSDLMITCTLSGNSVIFKGLDDVEKLKSVTFARGELTEIWIEEASEIIEADFQQLDIRLRGGTSQKQIVVTFNPIDVNHWLKKRFFDRKSENVTVLHTTYKDNRFLDDDYRRLLEGYREIDPYYYDVYCLGQWGVYGKTVFPARNIQDRIDADIKPDKTGYFVYTDDGTSITDIKWMDDPDGYIRIYNDVQVGTPYVIGGDTAGNGSDSFVAQVINNVTGQQVATMRHTFDEDLYAKQVYCLGMYYNTSLIGIETNFSTYPIRELERLKYPKQYVREAVDNYTHRPKQSFGFRTTGQTRPIILAELIRNVRETPEWIQDTATLHEMLTFVRNEKGRPEAQEGTHDDCIMAIAIAYGIRDQQDNILAGNPAPKAKWEPDQYDDYYAADDSMKCELIRKWGNPF